ncbi:MAG: phospho-sugar mutase, partial [Myxococcaceae bacterium]|nr:phospho-sugar mutase [Myxococcaceae bacterium]
EALLALRLHGRDAEKVRIVYTALHGVGGPWALRALREAGFTSVSPVEQQQEPDPAFPTVRFPNPEEPGALELATALAREKRADLVLANDPDADRLAVVVRASDGSLRLLTGNEVGLLMGHALLTRSRRNGLPPAVVSTIVSSAQLGEIARKMGAVYEEVLTGFKWIANRAIELEQQGRARFVFGFEEALGYTVGDVVRDKDGVGAALVFADLAAWCAGRGTTVLGYLEEIQREHGLFVSAQKSVTLPGAEGLATMARIMDAFRAGPPKRIGSASVVSVMDYARGGPLPPSNVLAFVLEGGARVTLRPSGTEPKIKYYFELKELPRMGEPIVAAHARAQERLATLESAFLVLAKERGQP